MGAVRVEDGCAFKAWASHANAVHVVGDLNGKKQSRDPLQAEANGYRYGFSKEARPGHDRLLVHDGGDRHSGIDPHARQVTCSVGNQVICDHGAFDRGGH